MNPENAPTPPRTRPVWPWIAAVAVLSVLLILSLAQAGSSSTTTAPVAPVAAAPALAPPATTSFAPYGYAVVPNFVGMTGDEASAAASARDFRGVSFTVNYAAMSSRVVSQYPPAGTNWNKIDSVQVTLDPATAATTTTTTSIAPPATTYAPPPPDKWTYKITGKNRGSITYTSEGGDTAQVTDARLPWTKQVEDPSVSGMTFAYVSAQNSGGGSISCQIVAPSGAVVAENTSEGAYAIVTCQN